MKLKAILTFSCFVLINFSVQSVHSIELSNNQKFYNYLVGFNFLREDETLQYSTKNSIGGVVLSLYAVDNQKPPRKLGDWENVVFGSYEFSTDRKRAIFATKFENANKHYFYIDGEKGTVSYLFDCVSSVRSSSSLDTILAYSISDSHKNGRHEFGIIDLKKKMLTNKFVWNIDSRVGGVVGIYRNLVGNSDFTIEYVVESVVYASGEVAADNRSIKTVYNVVNSGRDLSLPLQSHNLQELGRFPPLSGFP